MSSITPLGKKWEWRHSFWLLWLLFIYRRGYLVFMLFFYIGIRARKVKWILSGVVYLLINVGLIVMQYLNRNDELVDFAVGTTIGIFLTAFITAWTHAFWARKEYLQIIAQKEIAKQKQQAKEEKEKAQEKKIQRAIASAKGRPIASDKPQSTPHEEKPYNEGPISINTADRSELAALTGEDLATKIVQARQASGPFESLVDLLQHVTMKPHVLARIKKNLVFDEDKSETPEETEIKATYSQGRRVDF